MRITLTPRAEDLLRRIAGQHPGQSSTEIVERALAEQAEREPAIGPSANSPPAKKLTPEEFDKWLDAFSQFSDKIPQMPGETFSREMIYQDHD